MAAHTQFPPPGAEPVVRGDPTAMLVRFRRHGVDQDITTATWRCYVRDRIDGNLVNQCLDFSVAKPGDLPDLFPDSPSTVPCVLVASWTGDQTQEWASGYVADLEQLTPVKTTPIIFDALRVDRDVSYEPGSP